METKHIPFSLPENLLVSKNLSNIDILDSYVGKMFTIKLKLTDISNVDSVIDLLFIKYTNFDKYYKMSVELRTYSEISKAEFEEFELNEFYDRFRLELKGTFPISLEDNIYTSIEDGYVTIFEHVSGKPFFFSKPLDQKTLMIHNSFIIYRNHVNILTSDDQLEQEWKGSSKTDITVSNSKPTGMVIPFTKKNKEEESNDFIEVSSSSDSNVVSITKKFSNIVNIFSKKK